MNFFFIDYKDYDELVNILNLNFDYGDEFDEYFNKLDKEEKILVVEYIINLIKRDLNT